MKQLFKDDHCEAYLLDMTDSQSTIAKGSGWCTAIDDEKHPVHFYNYTEQGLLCVIRGRYKKGWRAIYQLFKRHGISGAAEVRARGNRTAFIYQILERFPALGPCLLEASFLPQKDGGWDSWGAIESRRFLFDRLEIEQAFERLANYVNQPRAAGPYVFHAEGPAPSVPLHESARAIKRISDQFKEVINRNLDMISMLPRDLRVGEVNVEMKPDDVAHGWIFSVSIRYTKGGKTNQRMFSKIVGNDYHNHLGPILSDALNSHLAHFTEIARQRDGC